MSYAYVFLTLFTCSGVYIVHFDHSPTFESPAKYRKIEFFLFPTFSFTLFKFFSLHLNVSFSPRTTIPFIKPQLIVILIPKYHSRYIASYGYTGVPYISANIFCKSRHLPNTDLHNYSTDLR